MTAALAAAARQRADQTRQRATEALQRLHATAQPITFAHVARTAGVSRSWLYRQPDLRADIDRLRRAATAQAVPVPSPERGSAESLRQRLEAALDEITRLKADNHQLREHLGPAPRPPAPKPHPRPVNDMSPTRNPSSEPPQRQALQITANNLIKRVKRAAFGFTNFDNYRIRALLYAGKPNWALLETLTPT